MKPSRRRQELRCLTSCTGGSATSMMKAMGDRHTCNSPADMRLSCAIVVTLSTVSLDHHEPASGYSISARPDALYNKNVRVTGKPHRYLPRRER